MNNASQGQPERGAFHAFEQAGWSRTSVVSTYLSSFGRLTTQIVPALLDVAGAGPGVHLLDVATGPGFVAAAAVQRRSSAIGIDFSPGMIAEARRNYPGIDFREGDALALDFPDNSFDAVAINFGVLHFEQPDRAIAEAFRVLKPGGRLAFTAWCEPDRAVAFGIVLQAVQAHGDPGVSIPPGPAFFRFSSQDECRLVLRQKGFVDADSREIAQEWEFATADDVIVAFEEGTVRTGGLLKGQTPEQMARIRAAVAATSKAYAQPDGTLRMPMPAVLAWGRKPN